MSYVDGAFLPTRAARPSFVLGGGEGRIGRMVHDSAIDTASELHVLDFNHKAAPYSVIYGFNIEIIYERWM